MEQLNNKMPITTQGYVAEREESLGGTKDLSSEQLKAEGSSADSPEDNPDHIADTDDLNEIRAADDVNEPNPEDDDLEPGANNDDLDDEDIKLNKSDLDEDTAENPENNS